MAEKRMGFCRPRLEFRMELAAQEPGMSGDLDDLGEAPVRGGAGDPETLLNKRLLELIVEFVAVAVALADLRLPVGRAGKGVLLEDAGVGPEPHRGPLFGDLLLFGEEVDHRVGGGLVELGAVRPGQAADVPRIFHDGHLHPETDPEEGDLPRPGPFDGGDHPFDPPVAEPAGDENPVGAFQAGFRAPPSRSSRNRRSGGSPGSRWRSRRGRAPRSGSCRSRSG